MKIMMTMIMVKVMIIITLLRFQWINKPSTVNVLLIEVLSPVCQHMYDQFVYKESLLYYSLPDCLVN